MRGFGSPSICSEVRTPSPQPSPLWGEGVFCASGHSWRTFLFSRRVSAPEFFRAQSRACQNVLTSSAKPVRRKERAGVGPAFRSSVTRASPIQTSSHKRRKRNAGKRWVATAASCDAARALLERARLTAFHHGSHLRELFHPKGSASGQASWDAVRTGVTRLRLSQSREAPPTPVVMPGDMIPKPPGSGLQTRPRAPPSLP
jgi:hypothetical protein